MKKIIIPLICMALILYTTFNYDKISSYIANKISDNQKLIINEPNSYAKTEGFKFVQLSEDYIPYSYNDLLDIIFTTINNGWDTFNFYCPSEYTKCMEDMEKISDDSLILTHINNYVHPFNSFTDINTIIYSSGQITINITHLYTDEQIAKINTEVDRLMKELVNPTASEYENIKSIHDYLINNTKYDQSKEADEMAIHPSALASGLLFDHLARCNGYTDTMAIFLSRLGIKNYKIATTSADVSYDSTGHVWNAVFYNGKWVHLDLTWDDPVSTSGQDYLYHKYFLVTTNEMAEADAGDVSIEEHNFRKDIYLEFN
ncbi:MAG: hypothetical protein IJO63_00545 [Bacilli bacterium]|nr:hypothetical protein [Bacilli bacterium]